MKYKIDLTREQAEDLLEWAFSQTHCESFVRWCVPRKDLSEWLDANVDGYNIGSRIRRTLQWGWVFKYGRKRRKYYTEPWFTIHFRRENDLVLFKLVWL